MRLKIRNKHFHPSAKKVKVYDEKEDKTKLVDITEALNIIKENGKDMVFVKDGDSPKKKVDKNDVV